MGSSLAINPRGGLYTDRGEKLEEVKGNGNTVDYTYFLDGLLKSQTEKKSNGTTLVSESVLDYDLNGNRSHDVTQKMNDDNHACSWPSSEVEVLKKVGFFPELDPKRAVEMGEPSIHASVRAVGEPDEGQILQYLDDGHMIIPAMEGGPDVITGEYGYQEASGCSSWISDGTWVWRYDLAHYLRRHHVELSTDFLSHVVSSGYIVPPLSDEEMLELADQLAADWKR